MLEIQTTGFGTVTVVVRGDLDMRHAPSLQAAITALLNRGDVTAIDLDLAGVRSVDPTGLGTIIVAHRIAGAVQVRLRLVAVSPPAARLLHVVRAEALMPARPRAATVA